LSSKILALYATQQLSCEKKKQEQTAHTLVATAITGEAMKRWGGVGGMGRESAGEAYKMLQAETIGVS